MRRRYTAPVEPELEQHIVDVCGGYPGVVAVYLFGSVALGTDRPSSDVDVAVLFQQPPPARLDGPRLVLEGNLERAIGRRVDLIVLNEAPADLRIRVLRDGRLLLERDRSARIAFEVRTRNEAFDLAPMLAAYRAPRTRAS
jgi:predicted nucleotidyltransferase